MNDSFSMHFTSHLCIVLGSSLVALACGGGASGHSSVAQDKSTLETTAQEEQEICSAWADYGLSVIGSAEGWCRWHGQNNTSGTTDPEVQASCDVAEATCLARKDEAFAELKASFEQGCQATDPLSETLLRPYATCQTTVGHLEDCGIEQLDTVASLRNVPCSEFTVARRTAINSDLGGPVCAEIPGAPCQ